MEEIKQEEIKVGEPKKFVGKRPKYKGNIEIAVWENETSEGRPYLALNIGGMRINCWSNIEQGGEEE